jgi:hypothetical protein
MTGPWTSGGRLATIAAWDVPLVRGAAVTMAAVADRLRSWRARLDGVGRELEAGRDWTGPSARSAVGALQEMSAAASAVDAAMSVSAAAFRRLAVEAAVAQELAAQAVLLPTGPLAEAVFPEPTPAELAMQHAAAVSAAAEEAGAALVALGTGMVVADLAEASHGPPATVPLGPPGDVAAWWAGLSAAAQLALIERRPSALGRLDGVPAWARDRANRRLLQQALADPALPPSAAGTARAVADRIRQEESAGRTVQLHLLDLEEDLVALAHGDLDTADAVAVLVPGINNSPADDLDALVGDAGDVGSATRAAAPGIAVATLVWLGYRTPHSLPAVLSRASAWRGGVALASDLAGLEASRAASGRAPARTTILAHSYGTVVLDEAADVHGTLAADALVLLGSPGMEGEAADLEAPEVYDVASDADLVAQLGYFGFPTDSDGFGATALPRDPGTGHSEYYARGSASLAAIGEVVGAPWPPP